MKKTSFMLAFLSFALASSPVLAAPKKKAKKSVVAKTSKKSERKVSAYTQNKSCPLPLAPQETKTVEITKEVPVVQVKEVIKEVPAPAPAPVVVAPQSQAKSSDTPVVIINHYGNDHAAAPVAPVVAPAPAPVVAPAPAPVVAPAPAPQNIVIKNIAKTEKKEAVSFDKQLNFSVMLGMGSMTGNQAKMTRETTAVLVPADPFNGTREFALGKKKGGLKYAAEVFVRTKNICGATYSPFLGMSVVALGGANSIRLSEKDAIDGKDYHKITNSFSAHALFHVGMMIKRVSFTVFAGMSGNMVRLPRFTAFIDVVETGIAGRNAGGTISPRFIAGFSRGVSVMGFITQHFFVRAMFLANTFRVGGFVRSGYRQNAAVAPFIAGDEFKVRLTQKCYLIGVGVAV